ncbi:proteasome assembly chaperone 1 [Thalassophryne amazonica]|uniref:proteasome assembly chaperone 1 n=1 Tax=Thalassophryne amazonica TaxID=390379 RepID=UPI00147165C5|nr:proteasome assembly chaperone 1 [Thalassophryne amazonica]
MMATFFGEVLSVFSRAVQEEDEEIYRELEDEREVHLHWIPDVAESLRCGTKLPCSQFILAVGHNATGFLSMYVLTPARWTKVGHATVWNERSRACAGPADLDCRCVFYRHKDKPLVWICQVSCFIAEDQLFQWTEKVLGCFQQRELNVMVLSDCSVIDYKTADHLDSNSAPFLRAVCTSTFGGRPLCWSLEQPNIVTGLPAAVLSHCQVHHIPSVLYQCYSDISSTDSVTMQTYKPTLSSLGDSIQVEASPCLDVLQPLLHGADVHSNLYM